MFLLADPALAAPLCTQTSATASANGAWKILDERDEDAAGDRREGGSAAAAFVSRRFGERRSEDLCGAEVLAGVERRGRVTDMIEVSLPGEASACVADLVAEGSAESSGSAWAARNAMRAGAEGQVKMSSAVENAAEMEMDGGAGGEFDGAWAWRSDGPTTSLLGFVEVDVADAYAGAFLSAPGLALVQAWDGEVDAWVRQGDHYAHYVGPAPVRLEIGVVVAGKSGTMCASGSASAGARVSGGRGDEAGSRLSFELEAAASGEAPDLVAPGAEIPEFEPCGCAG
jgi:hypothetical protein